MGCRHFSSSKFRTLFFPYSEDRHVKSRFLGSKTSILYFKHTNADNRLNSLEQKLETQALQLAKIEGAIATLGQRSYANSRRQAFNYHPPQLELQPYTKENLAKRLGVDTATRSS